MPIAYQKIKWKQWGLKISAGAQVSMMMNNKHSDIYEMQRIHKKEMRQAEIEWDIVSDWLIKYKAITIQPGIYVIRGIRFYLYDVMRILGI